MKIIHEIIEIIETLDPTNVEKLKPSLLKLAKLSALSFGEDEKRLSDKKIKEIYNKHLIFFNCVDSEFQNEIFLLTSTLNNEFFRIFEILIDEMTARGYLEDAIELSTLILSGMGAKARSLKLFTTHKKNLSAFLNSKEHITYLKEEISKQFNAQLFEGLYFKIVQVQGLIMLIKDHLDENSRNLASTIRTTLLLENRTIESLEQDPIFGKYFDPKYPKELKMRIYLWDKLTVDLRNEYSIDAILEQADANA